MALDEFLRAAKEKGASDEFLVAMLKEQGWPVRDVYQALGRFYTDATGIEIPEPRGRLESAREAFFHLLAFATLATWICATGNLWFELIDMWFPDPLMGRSYYQAWTWSRLAWQMASLMVAFPAFVWATRSILRDQELNPLQPSSAVRRWLTNLALLITAVVVIGDLVTFLAKLLQGEVTMRFALKCVVVLVLSGAVFLYYNRALGRGATAPRLWHRGFAWTALAAIAVTLALGFTKTGSPAAQRMLTEDRRRVQDLHSLAQGLWTGRRDTLPATLERRTPRVDPFTKAPYEYRVIDGAKYELCAVFAAESVPSPDGLEDQWQHGKGRHCFQLDVMVQPQWPGNW